MYTAKFKSETLSSQDAITLTTHEQKNRGPQKNGLFSKEERSIKKGALDSASEKPEVADKIRFILKPTSFF